MRNSERYLRCSIVLRSIKAWSRCSGATCCEIMRLSSSAGALILPPLPPTTAPGVAACKYAPAERKCTQYICDSSSSGKKAVLISKYKQEGSVPSGAANAPATATAQKYPDSLGCSQVQPRVPLSSHRSLILMLSCPLKSCIACTHPGVRAQDTCNSLRTWAPLFSYCHCTTMLSLSTFPPSLSPCAHTRLGFCPLFYFLYFFEKAPSITPPVL